MSLTIDPAQCLDEAAAIRVADRWNAVYPEMRAVLDDVIRANRGAIRPLVDVRGVERVRLELGQIDRGTHRPCTQSPQAFSPHAALCLVRDVMSVLSIGHPQAAGIYRLAAELADVTTELNDRRKATRRTAA